MIEVATDKDYAAHRVSYQLDLTGPSVCVQTSCSTALSCVALACADLHAEHSDYAIAAAASILFPQVLLPHALRERSGLDCETTYKSTAELVYPRSSPA